MNLSRYLFQEIKLSFTNLVEKYAELNPWSNVYGLARSFISFGLLLTIIFSDEQILFFDLIDNTNGPKAMLVEFEYNVFTVFSKNIIVGKIIAIFILLLVIIGILPQITTVLHWWVAFSFMQISPVIEGGDQLNTIVTLLLIPIGLTDNRINHWHPQKTRSSPRLKLFVWSCFVIITLQVGVVYFHACISKLRVNEWLNGTVVYYWASHNIFGVNNGLKPFVLTMLSNKFIVVFVTWGTLLLELILFGWLFMKRNNWNWKLLFVLSVSFHFGIIILHGLVSFFFAMLGALILYLIPKEFHIRFNYLGIKKNAHA